MKSPKRYPDDLKQLINLGACRVKDILSANELTSLLEEAKGLIFKQRQQITTTGVMQNFSGCDSFEKNSHFLSLAYDTAGMLNHLFAGMICKPIKFNDHSLQLYPVSKDGEEFAISPHKDHKNCINLIAVYVLKGKAPFCICPDRTGMNGMEIHSEPGDLILMRGTGFLDSEFRPFHFVGRVNEERITFGLRQTVDMNELPKY